MLTKVGIDHWREFQQSQYALLKGRKSSEMASCLMRFDQNGQEDPLERIQQALCGGLGRGTLGIARIQSGQASALLRQVTTDDKLQQRQDAQGERQQTQQSRGMVVALDIHGR